MSLIHIMVEKHNFYGIIAFILLISLYIGIPSDMFAGMAYNDYSTLNQAGLIGNFDKIQSYYNVLNIWGVLVSLIFLVLSFYFINKQYKLKPTLLTTISLILAIITSIFTAMGVFSLLLQ